MCRVQAGGRFNSEEFLAPGWLAQLVAGWRLQILLAVLFIASCLDFSASMLVFEGLGQRLAAAPFFALAAHQVSLFPSDCGLYVFHVLLTQISCSLFDLLDYPY